MSNFMDYENAEDVLTGYANKINANQNKELSTSINVFGQRCLTVESALQALASAISKQIGKYIPYSNASNIVCEAYADNYDPTSLSWGDGGAPITLTAAGTYDSTNKAVFLETSNPNKLAYVGLSQDNTPFTVYMVTKLVNIVNQASTYIGACYQKSVGNTLLTYGINNEIRCDSWGGTQVIVGSGITDYQVVVVQNKGNGGYLAGACSNLNPIVVQSASNLNNVGRYISIGRTSKTDPSGSYEHYVDHSLRYFAVTLDVDSEAVIRNNMAYLKDKFITNI